MFYALNLEKIIISGHYLQKPESSRRILEIYWFQFYLHHFQRVKIIINFHGLMDIFYYILFSIFHFVIHNARCCQTVVAHRMHISEQGSQNQINICYLSPPLTAASLIKIQKLVPDLQPLKTCSLSTSYPAGYYMPKVNSRNTRTMCEINPKLTIKTTERRHSGVFISNFEHISHLVLVFLMSTLSR